MPDGHDIVRQAVRGGAGILGSFLLWTVWLFLLLALALQIFIITRNELTVPDFAWRRVEAHLAAAGLRASIEGSSVDPAGRILLRQARVSVAGFSDPVLTARAVYVDLNPWMLAVGRFEPREIRISGATFLAPGRLSPSGTPEPLVQDLEAVLHPGDRLVEVAELNARVAGVIVTAHGSVPLRRTQAPLSPQDIARFFELRFAELCRQASGWAQRLQVLQQPSLHLEFDPSASGAPMADVTLQARGLEWPSPAIQAAGLRGSTRVLLLDQLTISRLEFAADSIATGWQGGWHARQLRGVLYGRIQGAPLRFEPRQLEFTADTLVGPDGTAAALAAEVWPRPWPRVDARIAGLLAGEPLALQADADLAAGRALLRAQGRLAPALLEVVGSRLKIDVRRYFDFAALDLVEAEARFGDDWSFREFTARVALEGIKAYGVTMDRGRAAVSFDGRRFHAPEAFATIGENFARGSFEQDLATREFRFLLAGQLRPMDIRRWFRPWWRNFFRQFEFSAAPPVASVDVGGFWREGWRTRVFVEAEARQPVIRGGAFDRVRTRLFIRPGFFDGLEVDGTLGPGEARGTFTFSTDLASRQWRSLELSVDSTLPLGLAQQVIGPFAERLLAPFALENPPELRMNATFAGPASAGGQHHRVNLQAQTAGEFRFHHFPLRDVSFTARIDDREITIDNFAAHFASGTATGHARVWGAADEQRLGFDLNLKDASLGPFAGALEEFFASRQGRPPAPPGKYVQAKANLQLDIDASAEGSYRNPLSFEGSGNAVLQGDDIGEVPLLGTLSELLSFTSLRLTSARANFRVDRTKLVFSEVALRGPSAAIDARGDYHLDRRQLDFTAKVFPFQESGNLIKSVVGAVLTPLSNALEVNLTGTLQKPEWAFVIGPTSFLRALNPEEAAAPALPAAPPKAPVDAPPAGPVEALPKESPAVSAEAPPKAPPEAPPE